MLQIPNLDEPSAVFGSIKHLPKRADLPEEYRRNWNSDRQPFCRAISMWFYKGAKIDNGKLVIDGITFAPKPGVDIHKALRAIKAVIESFEPKHEHKIGGCGFMLSEWFEIEQPNIGKRSP